VALADRAVRRAHGSTAATSRTAVMRDSWPWLTSVYNFFSDIMNRQVETVWKAAETAKLAKSGQWGEAAKSIPPLSASLFAYAIWPAIVEHMVSGEKTEEEEPWAKTAGKALARTAASSWIGVRDVANFALSGFDPQFGMAGTALKDFTQAWKDLAKEEPFATEHRGRLIQDGVTAFGVLTGMGPAQVGRTARFMHDVETGEADRPEGPWGWMTGLRFGTTKGHSTTFENYLKGRAE